ncbi:PadR family transcriptional regulator [Bacillus sp. SA1-12]|uniref:PadR family transcriptional regulator n=1 Tax=Bacillus sp. SA1-12 TaxID=1455638 RepID=UPI000695DD23|nr:PadR family transcriptional regulator [Bacillus sp. SA1-12]
MVSVFNKQDILTILIHISREDMSRERLQEILKNDIPIVDEVIDFLLQEEIILSKKNMLSLSEKGLKKSRHFFEKPAHLRDKMKSKFAKRRGLIQLAILQLLKEEPRHGYQVMKQLEERSGGLYSPSAGTVYPALQDLLDKELISVNEHADKKVYSLKQEGLKFLEDLVQDEAHVFWEEWRLRLMWKQSNEAAMVREEMDKFQLEFHYAMRTVLTNPALANELVTIIRKGRNELIQWSKETDKKEN